jgi:hypothetical protein
MYASVHAHVCLLYTYPCIIEPCCLHTVAVRGGGHSVCEILTLLHRHPAAMLDRVLSPKSRLRYPFFVN